MDPISAIGIATTAYNAIKRGFKVGKEIEGMSKDLGRWMGAIQDVNPGDLRDRLPGESEREYERYMARALGLTLTELRRQMNGGFGLRAPR